jgi:prepilin-type N-terminal cleavage/methylation domain-containing protein
MSDKYRLNNQGFSLIEVLVAMVIFSIGIIGVGKMQIAAIHGNASGRGVNDTVYQATDQIEKILLLPYDDDSLTAGITHSPDAVEAIDGYTLSWVVVDDSPVEGNKMVTITVTPTGQFSHRSFVMDQIKSEIN